MRRFPALVFALAALPACHDKVKTQGNVDSGITCADTERLINGECQFVCDRDSQCNADQRCNLFTGQCEQRPPPPDSGTPQFPCTNGAVRCSVDGKSIEQCGPDGTWSTKATCPAPDGFCQNEKCLTCQPGSVSCDPNNPNNARQCLPDGTGFSTIACARLATCQSGECRECTPNTTQCSTDGKAVQICQRTTDPTDAWKWVNNGDAFDGTCITQQCTLSPAPAHCVPPACFPGATQCKAGVTTTQQVCSQTGAWTDVLCSSLPGYGPGATCQNGVCVDECADAVKAKSYFGCEYWTAVMDNSIDSLFKGGALTGQGQTPSDFAFVVANQSLNPATVTVYRFLNGAPTQVGSTVTVPGRSDPTTKGLATIYVPWQSIGPASNTTAIASTGQARYAYRIVSSKPVAVYQFNPLTATKTINKTCKQDNMYPPLSSNCNDYGSFTSTDPNTWGICNNNVCAYNTYSNDASLLLPVHILGTSYVAMSNDHNVFTSSNGNSVLGNSNGNITIVATQDNTTVTVKSSAKTVAGGTVASLAKGSSTNFTLNSYDVLQLATDNLGTSTIECVNNPYDQTFQCVILGNCTKLCRVDNDLSGTVVLADKPIAVFGGAACAQKPYDRPACDHVEEEMFPFSTWGKNFVAIRSHAYRLANGQFSTSSPPDHWKIVAGCPASQCANGTKITLSPAPTSATTTAVLPNRCLNGTSILANNCQLAGGTAIEFKATNNFTISADQPIEVAQFFPGEGQATGSPTDPAEGDPSLVLLPPVEQWRSSYTVLAAPGIKDNYLGLAIDTAKVQSVSVDGVAVPMGSFVTATGTISVANVAVSTGTHQITVTAKAGVNPLPGAGLTIYGYDSYVSYGYTGGLDLGTIVTGINPGG